MKLVATFVALLTLVACNTIGGAGEDIQAGGEAITDTAEEIQSEL